MAAGDLTTLDNVKGWLGLTNPSQTDDDALLSRLITAISQFVQNDCGRQFSLQDYSEQRDGTGGRRLSLANYPISAVTCLSIDGQLVPPGDATRTPGFFFRPTELLLNGYIFHRGLGNVSVAYTAGYETVPADLEQACIEQIAFRYREISRIGIASKVMAGETTAFVIKDLLPWAARALGNFRRVVPV